MKRLGLAALLLAVLATVGVVVVQRSDHYTALFPDAAGIEAGDDVRVAGLTVGHVSDVTARADSVRVTFTSAKAVTKDTRVGIKIGSLLGERYLQLTPGNGPRLSSGGVLAKAQADGTYTLDRFWMDASAASGRLDLEAMKQAIDVLAHDLNTPAADTHDALQGLSNLTVISAKRSQQIDHLIDSVQSVTKLTNDQMSRVDRIMSNADAVMVAINQRRRALNDLIDSVKLMVNKLNRLAQTTAKPMQQALQRMRSVVGTLVQHREDLDRTLQLAGPAMRMYTNSLGDGPWLGVNAPFFVLPDAWYCAFGTAKGCVAQ